MYKVFIYDKTIFIGNDVNIVKVSDNHLIHNFSSVENLSVAIYNFAGNQENMFMTILTNHPKKILKLICKTFSLIKAAGGLVINEKNEILFIFRKQKWDLPKGKKDRGEKHKTTALREVEEECGIRGMKITTKLPPTFHIYMLNGELVIKKTKWYEMYYDRNETPVPQHSEQITEIRWFSKNNLSEPLSNTFPSISDLITKFQQATDY